MTPSLKLGAGKLKVKWNRLLTSGSRSERTLHFSRQLSTSVFIGARCSSALTSFCRTPSRGCINNNIPVLKLIFVSDGAMLPEVRPRLPLPQIGYFLPFLLRGLFQ